MIIVTPFVPVCAACVAGTTAASLVHLDPACTQEYKWRELEEQRQAQKLQKQLQQEQAYLLSLQQNQNLESSKPAQQPSAKPPQNPQNPEPDGLKPQPSPGAPPQNAHFESGPNGGAEAQPAVADPEPVTEVNPRRPTLSLCLP